MKEITVGDKLYDLTATLYQADGTTVINLTGATVKFQVAERRQDKSILKVDGACVVTGVPTDGTVSYTVQLADFDQVDEYWGKFVVTYIATGKVITCHMTESIRVINSKAVAS